MSRERVLAWAAGEATLAATVAALIEEGFADDDSPDDRTVVGVYEAAEARDYSAPGTWGEIESLWSTGKMSFEKYLELSAAVDAAVGLQERSGVAPE